MIHGATMRRASSDPPTATETTTIAASHAHAGTRLGALPRAAGRSYEDPRLARGARERRTHRRCRPRPPPRRSATAPRRPPRRRRRRPRAPRRRRRRQPASACSRSTYARAAAPSCRAVVRGDAERGLDRRDLVLVDRDLEHRVVGQLAEPADVGDEQRLAERRAADHRARRLAHRRVAKVDEHVARGHQRPHALLGHVVETLRRLRSARGARAGAGRRSARPRRRRAAAARRAAAGGTPRTPRAAAGSACSCSGSRSSRSADRR